MVPGTERLLQILRGQLDERRLRLFTCACLRRFGHIVENEQNRQAIKVEELYADGLSRKRDMKKARKVASLSWLISFDAYEEAVRTVRVAARVMTTAQQAVVEELLWDIAGRLPHPAPQHVYQALLRHGVSPDNAIHLRHPVALRPSWLRRNGGIVLKMAQSIYADQSFADLPILADALEEAGCDNAVILNHCRQPAEHTRGCWVLDLLLGKS